jgi:hypothetical protein
MGEDQENAVFSLGRSLGARLRKWWLREAPDACSARPLAAALAENRFRATPLYLQLLQPILCKLLSASKLVSGSGLEQKTPLMRAIESRN